MDNPMHSRLLTECLTSGAPATVVAAVLEAGAMPNGTDVTGRPVIRVAAFYAAPDVVELLLSKGADPNAIAPNGATALIAAAEFNRPEVAKTLLAHGADPRHRDCHGLAALDYAWRLGDEAIISLLEGAVARVSN